MRSLSNSLICRYASLKTSSREKTDVPGGTLEIIGGINCLCESMGAKQIRAIIKDDPQNLRDIKNKTN